MLRDQRERLVIFFKNILLSGRSSYVNVMSYVEVESDDKLCAIPVASKSMPSQLTSSKFVEPQVRLIFMN